MTYCKPAEETIRSRELRRRAALYREDAGRLRRAANGFTEVKGLPGDWYISHYAEARKLEERAISLEAEAERAERDQWFFDYQYDRLARWWSRCWGWLKPR